MNNKILIIVGLLAIVTCFIPTGYAHAADMAPIQGAVGIDVTVQGLSNGVAYKILWDETSVQEGTAGSTGYVKFNVPEAYNGEHTVKVEQPSGYQVFSGTFTVVPNIVISPTSGSSGTVITVTGHGFATDEEDVAVTYDGVNIATGITADADGFWTTTFNAPNSAKGNHAVDASGATTKGSDVVDKIFSVSPIVTAEPVTGGVGTVVTIKATGFTATEGSIKVLYSGKEVRTGITADASGAWTTSFTIPNSTKGSHVIDVQGTTTAANEVTDIVFTVSPTVSVTPTSGSVEDEIVVSGSGFANNETTIEVTFDGKTIMRNITADDNGFWTATSKVPAVSSGTHVVGAFGRITPTSDVSTVSFTTQSVLTIVPKNGNVGDELRVTGTGFNAGKDYSITYGSNSIASGSVNDSGTFQSIFKAPGGGSGSITVTATDTKGSTATTTFNMETTPPAVPEISSPRDGTTVGFMGNTKVTFKWGDVTDPSGVTYDITISDQSNFAKTLVTHSKLSETKYILSEAESLPNGEYYWRIRAVDGAGNASDWSPTALVKVGFMTTSTLIYIIVGIVALLIIIAVLNRVLRKKKPKRDWE
jgi:hypothetical protein